ncbi:uncharacterized protein LOC125670208 isoform X4 [Ostrea edulis]|uniref:uncharacterized protein LOC125670208 isoform X4 n=1 Tax=Ostrea edulis TaxID=37623 RepID=UPI0024AF95DB|nr:uncharacterized protein LOC125670208 isoform X4 [Ostrea edulis]
MSIDIHRIVIEIGLGDEKLARSLIVRSDDDETIQDWNTTLILVSHKSSTCVVSTTVETKTNKEVRVQIPADASFSKVMKDYTVYVFGVRAQDSKVVFESEVFLDPEHHENNDESTLHLSTVKVTITHTPASQYAIKCLHRGTCIIFLVDLESKEKYCFKSSGNAHKLITPLTPLKDYKLTLYLGDGMHPENVNLTSTAKSQFRAVMTKREIGLLCKEAAKFSFRFPYNPFVPISHLYRNKPDAYYNNIFTKKCGIMGKYMKNDGGDQASPLNRAIRGLFFSAHLMRDTLLPPIVSPFGDVRLHIPSTFFLNPHLNLYFADFYCHVVNHHVTLVVTVKESDSDKFCEERLVRLNPTNNPFLYFDARSNVSFVNMAVNIEVLYTEDIDLKKLRHPTRSGEVFFSKCPTKGDSKTKSFSGGPKNENCDICNLTPKHD